jgi:hypothetical protein
MSSAAWCEIHKDAILSVLEKSLREHPSYSELDIEIVWRNTPSRLKQDGYEVPNSDEDIEDKMASVIATESSVKYLTAINAKTDLCLRSFARANEFWICVASMVGSRSMPWYGEVLLRQLVSTLPKTH